MTLDVGVEPILSPKSHDSQSSKAGSRTLEDYPALLSYVTTQLFTHAAFAEVEGVDPSPIVFNSINTTMSPADHARHLLGAVGWCSEKTCPWILSPSTTRPSEACPPGSHPCGRSRLLWMGYSLVLVAVADTGSEIRRRRSRLLTTGGSGESSRSCPSYPQGDIPRRLGAVRCRHAEDMSPVHARILGPLPQLSFLDLQASLFSTWLQARDCFQKRRRVPSRQRGPPRAESNNTGLG